MSKKVSNITYNADGTYTVQMTDGDRTESITNQYVSDDYCQRITDLFRYFGIDSAIAGKPVQVDIDRVADKAVR